MSLRALHLLACQARVTRDDSGLCCVDVMFLERVLTRFV